jgi:rubrerythrin
MSDASTTTSVEALTTAPIQQVLDAMEAAELTPEDALQLSLVLLNFVEEVHLDNLEELLEQEQSDGVSIAVWAADTARLKTARELLEEVLGDDDDDEEAIDGLADDEEGDEG